MISEYIHKGLKKQSEGVIDPLRELKANTPLGRCHVLASNFLSDFSYLAICGHSIVHTVFLFHCRREGHRLHR